MYRDSTDYAQSEADAHMLMASFSDDELERAASDIAQAATFHCTQYWLCPF